MVAGGLTALSTAKALESLGRAPVLVGLIDPHILSLKRRLSTASLWRQIQHLFIEISKDTSLRIAFPGSVDPALEQMVSHWASLKEGPQRQAILEWAARHQLIPDQVTKDWLLQKLELIQKHNRLAGSYVLPKIKSPVVLWEATGEFSSGTETGMDFAQCTEGTFQRFELDADHFSIMHVPQVKNLAASLIQVLNNKRKEADPQGEKL